MRIIQRILFGLALAGLLVAQDTAPPAATEQRVVGDTQGWKQRVFVLKYADAQHVANVISVFGVSVKSDRDMHVVAVNAPAGIMTAIDEAVNHLDVPAAAQKDIDLTVYMIVASEQPAQGGDLPPELQPVASELKRIFPYKGLRLLDSILLRTQPGNRASANGVAIAGAERWPYDFWVTPSTVTDDPKGRLIRLDKLNLNVHLPEGRLAGIATEITVRDGQRVVVGKSNMAPDQSLILVVTAKITE